MKNLIFLAVLIFLLSFESFAQNNVQLNINHKLGSGAYFIEAPAKNNLNHDFKLTRVQYFLSEIKIIHDGGLETAFDDFWILADARGLTEVDMGNHNINAVEKVVFSIGVDSAHNHLDPATYPSGHPLAPSFPSMHWGWNAGYRFVALEGNGGSNYDQLVQLHGLGDANYFTTEVLVPTQAVNNQVVINIDADYTRGLEDMDVNSGVVVHGDYGQAKRCLENFRDHVFSASPLTSNEEIYGISKLEVFPNPANGAATLVLEATSNFTFQVVVTDVLGKQVLFYDQVNIGSIDLRLENPGMYFISLIQEGNLVATKKVISK